MHNSVSFKISTKYVKAHLKMSIYSEVTSILIYLHNNIYLSKVKGIELGTFGYWNFKYNIRLLPSDVMDDDSSTSFVHKYYRGVHYTLYFDVLTP